MEDDGHVCCILGVCCAAASEQRSALIAQIGKDCACDLATAGVMADWLMKHFDLAPAGTLKPFMKHLAAMVRQHDTQHGGIA